MTCLSPTARKGLNQASNSSVGLHSVQEPHGMASQAGRILPSGSALASRGAPARRMGWAAQGQGPARVKVPTWVASGKEHVPSLPGCPGT